MTGKRAIEILAEEFELAKSLSGDSDESPHHSLEELGEAIAMGMDAIIYKALVTGKSLTEEPEKPKPLTEEQKLKLEKVYAEDMDYLHKQHLEYLESKRRYCDELAKKLEKLKGGK